MKKTAASLSYGLVTAVCATIMLSSCSKEVPGEQMQYGIDISVVVPEPDSDPLTTRNGDPVTGEGDENRVSNLTFIVFKSDNSFELSKSVAIKTDNTSDDPMWNSATSSLRLLLTVGAKKIYVIANWSLTGTTEMPTLNGIQSISTLENHLRVHNGIIPGIPPVMTGYLPVSLAGGETNVKISLTRQIARVEVYPRIAKIVDALNATVSVEGIRFINMPQRAYLLSRGASPATGTWSQSAFTGTTTGPITSVEGGAITPTRYGRYYIPEHFGTAAAHTIMVIKAKYNGTDTYYFVDVNGNDNAEPSKYAVERNHSYHYTVIIQGIGSASPTPGTRSMNDGEDEPGISNIITQLEIKQL